VSECPDIRRASLGSARIFWRAAAKAGTLFGGTRKPFCWSSTSSERAPALTATAGRPVARASMVTILWVSVVLVMAKMLAAR